MHRRAMRRREVAAPLDDGSQMLGGRAAAAAHDVDAQLGDEPGMVLGELLRCEVVVHMAVDHAGQTGIGDAGDRHAGVGGEMSEVLSHLDGTGRAVDADDIGTQGIDGGERGGDLGAREHATGEFHRDLHLQRHLDSE